MEHEKMSKSYLEYCDVIVFVMSTAGTFAQIKNFEELREIVESKKKLIIVLNNKDSDLEITKYESQVRLEGIIKEVKSTFIKECIKYNISPQYVLFTLN